jgi:hypothetical protein
MRCPLKPGLACSASSEIMRSTPCPACSESGISYVRSSGTNLFIPNIAPNISEHMLAKRYVRSFPNLSANSEHSSEHHHGGGER